MILALVELSLILAERNSTDFANEAEYRAKEFQKSRVAGLYYENNLDNDGINNVGERDANDYLEAKPDGVYRIAIIGDSVAYGHGVESENILSEKMKDSLELSGYSNYEIMNFAVGGYSTSQQLIILKDKVLKFNPNLILWAYVMNDVASVLYHDALELGKEYYDPQLLIAEELGKRLFFVRENLLAKQNNCQDREYHRYLYCVYWDYLKADLDEIKQVADSHEIDLMFIIFPIFDESPLVPYSFQDLHTKILALLQTKNLKVIDMVKTFQQWPVTELTTLWENQIDAYHPNTFGHQIAGEEIARQLIEQGYLNK